MEYSEEPATFFKYSATLNIAYMTTYLLRMLLTAKI